MIQFHPEVLYQLPYKSRQHSISIQSLTWHSKSLLFSIGKIKTTWDLPILCPLASSYNTSEQENHHCINTPLFQRVESWSSYLDSMGRYHSAVFCFQSSVSHGGVGRVRLWALISSALQKGLRAHLSQQKELHAFCMFWWSTGNRL